MKKRLTLLVALLGVATLALAAPAGKMTSLKFDVDMKIKMNMGAMGKMGGKAPPQMPSEIPMSMKFMVKDEKNMRMEMDISGMMSAMGKGKGMGMPMKMTMLVENGTSYMLNDAQKTAMKMGGAGGMGGMGMGPMGGMESMMSNPKNFDPKSLEQLGLKKSGKSKVGKEAVDVFKGKFKPPGAGGNPMGAMDMDTVMYLRTSDHFPVKMEMKNPMMDMTMNFKNIVKNPKLDPALFKLPKGYAVSDPGAMMGKMGGKMGGPPMGKK